MRPFSMIDYPGKLSCIVFVGDCNFRCPYCHNPCLVFDPESQTEITETEFMNFLDSRSGKLDGVVISGGEPTLRAGLLNFVKKIKAKSFLVKLDTNASQPGKVFTMHHEAGLDAMGIDYKAPKAKYNEVTRCGSRDIAEKVQSVISFAAKENIALDVRTTVHKHLLSITDMKTMRTELSALGVREWTLQQFNPVDIIDESLLEEPTYSDLELLNIAEELGNGTRVRGLKGIFIKR